MFPFAHSIPGNEILGVDPTDHGSNLGVVAALAVILVLIGLLVVLITRRGGRGPRKR